MTTLSIPRTASLALALALALMLLLVPSAWAAMRADAPPTAPPDGIPTIGAEFGAHVAAHAGGDGHLGLEHNPGEHFGVVELPHPVD